ncbi:MAG: hypothetical protein IJE60_05635 [Tyzzerella sp.]|nr:hypothetical protein [Tyzzerella sp.]
MLVLRDMIESDIEDYVSWFTREIERMRNKSIFNEYIGTFVKQKRKMKE